MSEKGSRRWRPIYIGGMAALMVATLGVLATDLGPWYQSLKQPTWKPPDALFGPAWTLIFALWGLAAATAWKATPTPSGRRLILWAFAANGALNVLWSLLFFRAQRPDWALIEVGVFWISIAALIVLVVPRSRTAAWLLVPYLVWVGFAGYLNYAVVQLNHPF